MRLNINSLAATIRARDALRQLAEEKMLAPSWSLFLDKFSFERPDAEAKIEEEPPKTRALRDLQELYNGESVRKQLTAACDNNLRWLLALEEQFGNVRFRDVPLVNESRLLVHLGRSSVLENVGLCTDQITGLPWIPGTALKGILSTWALLEGYFGRAGTLGEIQMPPKPGGHIGETLPLTRSWVAINGPDRSDLASRIFGDDSPTGSERAGGVVFVGGFPDSCPKLGLDIVNPHYDEERNQKTGKVVNVRDKRNLTPNIFLALEPGTVWHFIFYSTASEDADPGLLQVTERWLKEVLTITGLGAKTAAGYGRFVEPNSTQKEALDNRKKKRKEARKLITVSPKDRPYIEFISSVTDWDATFRDLAQLDVSHKVHLKRFLTTNEGQSMVTKWQASRGGRRQIKHLQEAGLL